MDERSEQFVRFLLNFKNFMKKMFIDEFDNNGHKKESLSHNQFGIIFNIAELKKCTISDLECVMPSSKSALSLALTKLEKNGYVVRKYPCCTEDKRLVYFENTEKSKNEIKMMTGMLVKKFMTFNENLNAETREELKTSLMTLNKIFEEGNKGNENN